MKSHHGALGRNHVHAKHQNESENRWSANQPAERDGRIRNRHDRREDRRDRPAAGNWGQPDGPRESAKAEPDLESQRRALLALQARLRGEVVESADEALSGCGIESSCGSPDTADRASEVVEQDVVLGLLGSVGGNLEEIDAALTRIEDGSYGRCQECGAKIPAARLEVLPYAAYCVQCAARRERVA